MLIYAPSLLAHNNKRLGCSSMKTVVRIEALFSSFLAVQCIDFETIAALSGRHRALGVIKCIGISDFTRKAC